jgi:hypothetical protein
MELKEAYARYRQTLKIIRHVRDLIPEQERDQRRETEKVIEKRVEELELEQINPPKVRKLGESAWREGTDHA